MGNPQEPNVFETVFRWMLLETVDNPDQHNVTSLILSIAETLDSTIKRFWELEEISAVRRLSLFDDSVELIHQ